MEIKYYDDKKEKYQSHEISIDVLEDWTINSMNNYHIQLSLTGYGQNKPEAIENFDVGKNEIIEKLQQLIEELKQIDIRY